MCTISPLSSIAIKNISKHAVKVFRSLISNDSRNLISFARRSLPAAVKIKSAPIGYQKFLNHLGDQGYSKSTIQIIHNTMNGALEKAVILGKLEKNPCKGVTIKGLLKQRV